ncbi:type II secretion system protein N [Glaciecola siphonariae]|uniref:Type II secretion system protein N n=1 Tax=Glaciecola siphonariae TaxID=521012 RepID=A0ABV9LQ47_9ALTE
MKTWHWIVLAIISYIGFLIAYLPAAYVADVLHEQSKQELKLSGVNGTLFSGSALSLDASGFRVNNLTWELNPWALFLLKANIDIKGGALRDSEQLYISGKASVNLLSTNTFSLEQTQMLVPAKSVLSQFRLPIAVTANGRFRIDIDTLDMTPQCTALRGNGAWLNAEVDTPQQAVNLGSFEANLSCSEGNLTVEILPENSLQLSANILVDAEGRYEASGQFKPDDALPEVIQQAADTFFRVNQQGFYLIEL